MKFEQLLHLVDNEPVFETGLFLAGEIDPHHVRRQLSCWVRAGKIYQVMHDVQPLLELGSNPDLLTLENVLRVLGSHRQ